MPEQYIFPDWRNENENTKFPFADGATLISDQSDFIPEGTFLDARIHPIGSTNGMYLSGLNIVGGQATLSISDDNTTNLCSTVFSVTDTTYDDDVDVRLALTDIYGRPAGMLLSTSLRLAIFQTWPQGLHTFIRSASEFVATVCIPMPEIGVRGFLLDDGTVVSGDVWFMGDDGVVLTSQDKPVAADCETSGEAMTKVIYVNAVGDPLYRRRLCAQPTYFSTPRFITSLILKSGNTRVVLTPDDSGDIKLFIGSERYPLTILRLTPTEDGMSIGVVGQKLGE